MVYSVAISTMENNDSGRRHNVVRKGAIFKREVRNKFIEKVIFEQRFEECKRVSQKHRKEKTVPSRQNSKCKGLKVRVLLACSRRSVWLEWGK